MSDRLAELLRDAYGHPDDHRRAAARLEAQGVRVGDPPPPADEAGGLRAAVRLFIALAHPSSDLPDRYIVHREDLSALRAALAAQPAPTNPAMAAHGHRPVESVRGGLRCWVDNEPWPCRDTLAAQPIPTLDRAP